MSWVIYSEDEKYELQLRKSKISGQLINAELQHTIDNALHCSSGLCSGLWCHVTWWLVPNLYRQHIGPIFKGQKLFMDFLILENEMTMLFQNTVYQCPSDMGPYSRRTGNSNGLLYYSKYQWHHHKSTTESHVNKPHTSHIHNNFHIACPLFPDLHQRFPCENLWVWMLSSLMLDASPTSLYLQFNNNSKE